MNNIMNLMSILNKHNYGHVYSMKVNGNNQNRCWNSMFQKQCDGRSTRKLSAKLNNNASSTGLGKHRHTQMLSKIKLLTWIIITFE